ncbi:thymidine phosphorylase family protein [Kordiimonas marina]|uniref:thymidine phosphorylase family protein n=1 Tax=Kordiimonas marina TaxID=2872312 RepID=UPI001FF2AACA|nr:thymidine phosphorylase family protein [Kordiimonas marina]MCJ9428819.1 thymidine phosphorylase family protein [Kordiimonas marina]
MLKLKRVAIDTYRENVAYLARDCSVYRPEEYQAFKKIEVIHDGRQLLASLMIVDDDGIVSGEELGLSEQAFNRLGVSEGDEITIAPAEPPKSLDYLRRKIHGHTLEADQIKAIISDIASHRYSEMEIAAFLVSCAGFLTTSEMLALTRSMADVGNKLTWRSPIIVDKHCIGGVPGNRTSMIVVPIVAAHGLTIPKTSSRAITSPAGTADTMEVLARVDLTMHEMQEVVGACNGCLVWGGHVNLSPADDVLISVERPLSIDTREQMVASIMSKKMSAGSTHLLIDIPIGPSSKVHGHEEAMRLRKLFEYVGREVGLHVEVVTTDGSQPIGRGIGPVLEARDVMAVLNNEPDAPADLREKALQLAGAILEADPALEGGSGYERAQQLLESGEALKSMNKIIDAQGRQSAQPCAGALTHDVLASKTGTVIAIDCFRINRIARLAGAPMDKGAGIDMFKKVGDTVEAGEPLYRIHACFESDFKFTKAYAEEDSGYALGGHS